MEDILCKIIDKKILFSFNIGEKLNIYHWSEDMPVPSLKISSSGHRLTFWKIEKKNKKIGKIILTDIRYFKGLTEFLDNNKNIIDELIIISEVE